VGVKRPAVSNPIIIGVLVALAAAVCFGVTAPFIQSLGRGLGPFTTAGLLYLGAALGSLRLPRRGVERLEPPLRRAHLGRLAAVAFFGAALAPTLFAWGLQRVSATTASLLLNAEAVFTVALAALVWREQVGRRALLAAAIMCLAGIVAVGGAPRSSHGLVGIAAILGAVLAWALDNVLTRPLADLDPAAVVRGKALLGVTLTAALALLRREPFPTFGVLSGLLLCGATGYGLSLRLYLLAQRRIGAARTGSIFALAPFIGAAVAMLLGDRSPSWATGLAVVLFAAGAVLHLTEKHAHGHHHEALEHEHAHRHDDGHHDHAFGADSPQPHSHPHRHPEREHSHPHGPDAHHGHSHED
jgi:drug/metabolite transporter (DMT)-like permease